jgi:hypothetical protein
MKVSQAGEDLYSIVLTGEELRILKDCLVNLNNDMGDDDLSTRVGSTRGELRGFIDSLLSAF